MTYQILNYLIKLINKGEAVMVLNNEAYIDRRKLWSYIPSKYHKGEELCIQRSGELEGKFSFFGQGLLLIIAYYPEVKWNIIHTKDNNIIWGVDDTTSLLSEFYGIDACVLDTIYNMQCSAEHNRNNLVDIIMSAPVYAS